MDEHGLQDLLEQLLRLRGTISDSRDRAAITAFNDIVSTVKRAQGPDAARPLKDDNRSWQQRTADSFAETCREWRLNHGSPKADRRRLPAADSFEEMCRKLRLDAKHHA